ncbi:gamma-glutamyl-gamma-aminobutyrate hydrolase family protein [Phocicoccus pinnipedialis]|uniref:Glutamine amidotransferasec n=1 Tax=Phocicoccus pinnipedialis TaxID=110845 RepID=A0A6V7R5I9_9BACL|nr:gamma-glutamyl-gamma-aminobutyrate hydrolase family protein [Jeotgalicoccus pinnipedialis]MBP1939666.1 putative glutamine amidotransferase [Jeotgalicoccus pinnipedialis]CAD2072288.1 Putative glutamine amidotransferasec [Jeotgalicoccus pinnipedialis]
MKPLIGVTANLVDENRLSLHQSNYNRIIEAGGVPVMLPINDDETTIQALIERLDGIVFTGGADVNPIYYNEDPLQQLQEISPGRDAFEFALAEAALKSRTPILAICRGAQVINVACGGTLYQDIPTQVGASAMQHVQLAVNEHASHSVTIDPQSQFAGIYSDAKIMVNSFHHQSIKTPGSGLKAVAHSNDSIIEAIESTTDHYLLGVQWHPEYIVDEDTNLLYRTFVNACTK